MTAAREPHRTEEGAPRSARGPARASLLAAAAAAALAVCATAHAATAPYRWRLPANFPTPRVPPTNPVTPQKADLGRFLFYDKRLSGNGTQACGTCHLQALAFTDGRARAVGSTGEDHPRNAQPLANVVYNATLTWANPSLVRLEKQMEVPLFGDNPVEMGVNDRNKGAVIARIRKAAVYRAKFRAAYPGQKQPVNWPNVIAAISTFQRTLISGNSRYDRYLRGAATLTASETRGKDLFFGERAECHHCHSSFNLNDQTVYAGSRAQPTPFHNTGLYNVGGTGEFPAPNRGVFELTARAADMGRFRAPSLRNVEVTAPYMHDGSVATLEDVVAFYAAGGRVITDGPLAGDGRLNPFKSDLVSGIDLTEQEKADIVAFLRTLTDREFLTAKRFSDPFARP